MPGSHSVAYFGENIDAAIEMIDRALTLNPSFARGWVISGWLKPSAISTQSRTAGKRIGGAAEEIRWSSAAPRSARRDAENAEAVLGIVERDALDEAGEDFLVRGVGARMQPDVHEVPSSAAVNSSLMVENC